MKFVRFLPTLTSLFVLKTSGTKLDAIHICPHESLVVCRITVWPITHWASHAVQWSYCKPGILTESYINNTASCVYSELRIFTNPSGEVASSFYRTYKKTDEDCLYQVIVQNASSISITSSELDIECCCETLRVYAGSEPDVNFLLYDR